jgi:hypothetical protein
VRVTHAQRRQKRIALGLAVERGGLHTSTIADVRRDADAGHVIVS